MFNNKQSVDSGPQGIPRRSTELTTEPHVTLASAREAAQQAGLKYAGDVTPQEAWALFSAGIAELVDVRTDRELQRVGYGFCTPFVGAGAKACASVLGAGSVPTSGRAGAGA